MAPQTMPADEADGGCPNSVLGKAQLLLGAFESGAYQLKLTELSRRSGVSKASTYRLAQEMVQWGLLERQGDAYQLGLRLFELGQRVPVSAVLQSIARPPLIDLFAATRAVIHLAVLDGGHVLYLEKISGEANTDRCSRVGGRLPASCTATGKLLLALTPEGSLQRQRIEHAPLPMLTSRTVSSFEQLDRQLVVARSGGYSIELEEIRPGMASLAVAIAGPGGAIYGAISATGPIRLVEPRRLLPELRSTAAAIARSVDRATLTGGHVAA